MPFPSPPQPLEPHRSGPAMFCLLGPVGISTGDGFVTPPSAMICGLLAVLLTESGRIVPTYRLIDALWEEDPPPSAESNLRGYVTRVRRMLPPASIDRLVTRRGNGGGYGMLTGDEDLDLPQFREAMAAGRRFAQAHDWIAAAKRMRHAVGMWRGPFGMDLPDTWFLRTVATGMNTERLCAVEELAAVELRLRNGHTVAAYLTQVVAADPTREKAWAMLALAHSMIAGSSTAHKTIQEARRVLNHVVGPYPQLHLEKVARAVGRGDISSELDAVTMA